MGGRGGDTHCRRSGRLAAVGDTHWGGLGDTHRSGPEGEARDTRWCDEERASVGLHGTRCWTKSATWVQIQVAAKDHAMDGGHELLNRPVSEATVGAGNGVRTRDPNLGKVVLYH